MLTVTVQYVLHMLQYILNLMSTLAAYDKIFTFVCVVHVVLTFVYRSCSRLTFGRGSPRYHPVPSSINPANGKLIMQTYKILNYFEEWSIKA
jgi:hypothetical protein